MMKNTILGILLLLGIASAADISTCPLTLNASTNYTMTADCQVNGSTAYTIGGANVKLDCAGHTITGNNTIGTYGIYSNQSNTTIKNCIIRNFEMDIHFFTGANNGTINNVTATSATHGVYLFNNANGNTITGVTTSNVTNGIYVRVCSSTIVSDSVASATTGTGVYIRGSGGAPYYNIVTNVSATATTGIGRGIRIEASSSNSVINSTSISSTDYGIYITTTSNNNNITNTVASSNTSSGIVIDGGTGNIIDCQGGTLTGNNVSGKYGVSLGANSNTVKNCKLDNWGIGAYVSGSYNLLDNITVTNQSNTFSVSSSGVGVQIGGKYNTLANSNLNMSLASSIPIVAYTVGTGSFIANNTLTSIGSRPAIWLVPGGGATIQNNTLSTVTGNGITIDAATGGANRDNWFCWNNFTGVGGAYISDANGNNTASCLINGKWEGNFYSEVVGNDSYNGTYASDIGAGWYAGNGRAFTSSKMVGITDLAPMTNNANASFPAETSCSPQINLTNNNITTLATDYFANGTNCFATPAIASNITLDCAGHIIRGTDTNNTYAWNSAVVASSSSTSITIKNCIMNGFGNGIYWRDLRNGLITNNTINTRYPYTSSTVGNGISGSGNILVVNNTFSGNTIYSRFGYVIMGVGGSGTGANATQNYSMVANNTFNGVVGAASYTSFLNNTVSLNPTSTSLMGYDMDRAINGSIDSGDCILDNETSNNTIITLDTEDCAITANFIYAGTTEINATWAIGALDTGYFTSFGSWADVMNVTTTPAYAFLNCTVNTYRGAVLVKSVSQTTISNGNYSLASGTGLAEGYTYSVNATCYGTGADSSTETRTRTLIAAPAATLTSGGNTMADIVTAYIIFGGIMWLVAAFLYLQRKAVALAFPFYIFGIILFFTATVASAEAAASIENYGTMNMMFMLMIGLQWLLLISIGAAFLYIIIMIIDWLAKLINVKLEKRNLEGHL